MSLTCSDAVAFRSVCRSPGGAAMLTGRALGSAAGHHPDELDDVCRLGPVEAVPQNRAQRDALGIEVGPRAGDQMDVLALDHERAGGGAAPAQSPQMSPSAITPSGTQCNGVPLISYLVRCVGSACSMLILETTVSVS